MTRKTYALNREELVAIVGHLDRQLAKLRQALEGLLVEAAQSSPYKSEGLLEAMEQARAALPRVGGGGGEEKEVA